MIPINVAIRVKNIEILEFFYPNYRVTDTYSPFIEGGVIFTGNSKFLPMFRDNNIPYIYAAGTPEYDLTIPVNLLNFVLSRWDKKPTKKLLDYFDSLDFKHNADEIYDVCKQLWVTGKCLLDVDDSKQMNLYHALAYDNPIDMIKNYLNLSSDIGNERTFSRVLSFLDKSKDSSNVHNIYVKKCLDRFKEDRYANVKNALLAYLYSPTDNNEIKTFKLLENLTTVIRRN